MPARTKRLPKSLGKTDFDAMNAPASRLWWWLDRSRRSVFLFQIPLIFFHAPDPIGSTLPRFPPLLSPHDILPLALD